MQEPGRGRAHLQYHYSGGGGRRIGGSHSEHCLKSEYTVSLQCVQPSGLNYRLKLFRKKKNVFILSMCGLCFFVIGL